MNIERLEQLLNDIASQIDVDLVDYSVFQAGARKILRIYIDAATGITVDICAKYSRELGAVLDLEDLIEEEYTLEVSSPGVDRPLTTTKDFERNIGRHVKLTFAEPIPEAGGKKFIVGKLTAADETTVELELKKGNAKIPRENILKAKIEIQF